MTALVPNESFGGLNLTKIQADAMAMGIERIAEQSGAFPIPDSIRQDTAGTVHFTWLIGGVRLRMTLGSAGLVETDLTMEAHGDLNKMAQAVGFQVALQEMFRIA